MLPVPMNGFISFAMDPEDALGLTTTAIYTCESGYFLVGGNFVRTCIGPGGWTGSAPTCDGKI